MTKTKKRWFSTVEPNDDPEFFMVTIPDELLKQLGWEVGDKIDAEIVEDRIVPTKLG